MFQWKTGSKGYHGMKIHSSHTIYVYLSAVFNSAGLVSWIEVKHVFNMKQQTRLFSSL